jgi:hypothetical protein
MSLAEWRKRYLYSIIYVKYSKNVRNYEIILHVLCRMAYLDVIKIYFLINNVNERHVPLIKTNIICY